MTEQQHTRRFTDDHRWHITPAGWTVFGLCLFWSIVLWPIVNDCLGR